MHQTWHQFPTRAAGAQTWSTQTCPLSGASGYQNVYLVYSGTGPLPNLEWFEFQNTGNEIEAGGYNSDFIASGSIGAGTSTEGGLYLNGVCAG